VTGFRSYSSSYENIYFRQAVLPATFPWFSGQGQFGRRVTISSIEWSCVSNRSGTFPRLNRQQLPLPKKKKKQEVRGRTYDDHFPCLTGANRTDRQVEI
jgi:hypothetical protein